MSEELRDLSNPPIPHNAAACFKLLRDIRVEIEKLVSTRERAVVLTKLDEMQLWLVAHNRGGATKVS